MTDAPLTEEELAAIERRLESEPVIAYTCGKCGAVNRTPTNVTRDHVATEIPRLVAEVRRLRALVQSIPVARLQEFGDCPFCGQNLSIPRGESQGCYPDCVWHDLEREAKP